MKQRGPKLLVIHEQAVWTGRGEDPQDHGEEVSVTLASYAWKEHSRVVRKHWRKWVELGGRVEGEKRRM